MRDLRRAFVDYLRGHAVRLAGEQGDYDKLIERARGARVVLLGEATHGTHDFYSERAAITKRLIEELGFDAVAIEGDFPDAYRVNRWVRGRGSDSDAETALGGFKRFPTWMWRNADVLDFVGWLRTHNEQAKRPVSFWGLDLYSLFTSMETVVKSLEGIDPAAAERARKRYACFDNYGQDSQDYGTSAAFGAGDSCEREVIAQLVELRDKAGTWLEGGDHDRREQLFCIEQNARLVKNAEQYYRTMFFGRISSWNQRDRHMMETLEAVLGHLDRQRPGSKIVVWEHNSHLGDARATDMGKAGELNVGQLVRERFGKEALLVGFTTYDGTVTAASGWDAPAERKTVRPALPESYEAVFHDTGIPRFMVCFGKEREQVAPLVASRLERAIGVIYMPETERVSHYFHALLPGQFDVVLHFDRTRAVEPLERTMGWVQGEPPETYPFAV